MFLCSPLWSFAVLCGPLRYLVIPHFSRGHESVPIQFAQCRFPGPSAKILVYFQIKYTEAILSNSTQKLLWFEITKMLIAV